MVTLPHDPRQAQGCWWINPGVPAVCISCPECGAKGALDHAVAMNGTVTPSVICPGRAERMRVEPDGTIAHELGEPGCGFHQMIRLEEWPGWIVPDRE